MSEPYPAPPASASGVTAGENFILTDSGKLIPRENIVHIERSTTNLVFTLIDSVTESITYASVQVAVAAHDELLKKLGMAASALALDVHSVSPATGAAAGGVWVYVRGVGFGRNCWVKFDSTVCDFMYTIDSRTIRCMTPAHAAGLVNVSVSQNKGSSYKTGSNLFTYT